MGARVELAPEYFSSLAHLPHILPGVDVAAVTLRVAEFADFKRTHGAIAFLRYGDDKSSSHNREGRLIGPYHQDRFHHCHLGLAGADPIVAYRVLEPQIFVIVCVTTHTEMFKGNRSRFIRRYSAQFPNTLRRRPEFRVVRPKS